MCEAVTYEAEELAKWKGPLKLTPFLPHLQQTFCLGLPLEATEGAKMKRK